MPPPLVKLQSQLRRPTLKLSPVNGVKAVAENCQHPIITPSFIPSALPTQQLSLGFKLLAMIYASKQLKSVIKT